MGLLENIIQERDELLIEVRKLRAEKDSLTVSIVELEKELLVPADYTTHPSQRGHF